MLFEKEHLIRDWNALMPSYPITSDDLEKPSPVFFIEAILKLFESFDIQADEILRTKFSNGVDNCGIPDEYSILENLATATNFLLADMDQPDSRRIHLNITMFDLLMPIPSTVQTCLGLLHNFGIFIRQRRHELLEREKEIDELIQKKNMFTNEEDQLKIEIDQKYMEKGHIEKSIHLKETEIKMLKSNIKEPESEVNELKTQLDMIQAQRESIQVELLHKHSSHTALEEEMLKLKAFIITENEQTEILNLRESAIQRDIEIKQKQGDISKKLMKKDADINTLKAVGLNLSECHALLGSLDELCSKIKEIQNLNSAPYEEEKSLRHVQECNASLEHKYAEFKTIESQLDEELELLNSEIKKDTININKEENVFAREIKANNAAINNSQKSIKEIKDKTFEYDAEYKKLMKLYTEDIPAIYDQTINNNFGDINTILEDLEYVHRK